MYDNFLSCMSNVYHGHFHDPYPLLLLLLTAVPCKLGVQLAQSVLSERKRLDVHKQPGKRQHQLLLIYNCANTQTKTTVPTNACLAH